MERHTGNALYSRCEQSIGVFTEPATKGPTTMRVHVASVLLLVLGATSNVEAEESYRPDQAIVRFQPGLVEFPEHLGREVSLEQIAFGSESTRTLLRGLSVVSFRTIAPEWRHLPLPPHVDIHGNELAKPLIDFTDVYLLTLATSDAAAVVGTLGRMEQTVVYAQTNDRVRGTADGDCDPDSVIVNDEFFPETSTFPGQFCFNNTGVYQVGADTALVDIDINLREGWDVWSDVTVKVGIVDVEFDKDHDDLAGVFDPNLSACFPADPLSTCDWFGTAGQDHGTSCAGFLAARANNDCDVNGEECLGVVGVLGNAPSISSTPPVVALRVEATAGATYVDGLCDAFEYAHTASLPIVSSSRVSSSGGGASFCLAEAVSNLAQSGILLVNSSSNQADDFPTLPVRWDSLTLGVGAVTIEGQAPVGYHRGPWIDVVAPGGTGPAPHTTARGNNYTAFGGTSASAPQVAGVAALIASHTTHAEREDLVSIIARRAVLLPGQMEPDSTFGSGLVKLDRSLCWVEDRDLVHGTKSQTPTPTEHAVEQRSFRHCEDFQPGSSSETLYTKVWEYEVSVTFPPHSGILDSTHVWARDHLSPGWRDTSDVNGIEDMTWAGVRNVTSSGCDLYSYFYEVYNDALLTDFRGWHPYDPTGVQPSPMQWRYSAMLEPSSSRASESSSADLDMDRSVDATQFVVPVSIEGAVQVEAFDVRGRSVKSWDTLPVQPGMTVIEWDMELRSASAGVYFLRATTPSGRRIVGKVVHR